MRGRARPLFWVYPKRLYTDARCADGVVSSNVILSGTYLNSVPPSRLTPAWNGKFEESPASIESQRQTTYAKWYGLTIATVATKRMTTPPGAVRGYWPYISST